MSVAAGFIGGGAINFGWPHGDRYQPLPGQPTKVSARRPSVAGSSAKLHSGTPGLSAIARVVRRWSYLVPVTRPPEQP